MSRTEIRPIAGREQPAEPAQPMAFGRGFSKIAGWHIALLAIVYIRQSSLQQVLQHQESRARQYELAEWAARLGWPPERVLIIDDDQGLSGQSAETRTGFQRLLAEVSMGHVGLVLGLEMSRLARSSVDFQHLLEICALRGTLIADQEGVYDPRDANDRLLLGLKGTMSEFELVTMRNRLERGKLHKAERGALFHGAPIGYVKTSAGQLELDPDEEVRAIVRLVFDKFAELGSLGALWRYLLQQRVRLGVRLARGPRRGQLEWQRPRSSTLRQMLHHPTYAGAYVYGRSISGPGGKRTQVGAMEQWKVLKRDCLPAYIRWEQYLSNQERLRQNRCLPGVPGAPRQGLALLPGLLICGTCGHRMQAVYPRRGRPLYRCRWQQKRGEPQTCYGLASVAVDELVAHQVLQALAPAAVELHLKARQDIQNERLRLDEHWQQRLERARFEAERIERQYHAVEPENRLVARTLEQRWEEALRQQRALQEEYDRFRHTQPAELTTQERALIANLSNDIPALWHAPTTSVVERKEMVRCLLKEVVVRVQPTSEVVEVAIHWHGGMSTCHTVSRPVRKLAQLHDSARLLARITELRCGGATARQIAIRLNEEGFVPPQRRGPFNYDGVRQQLLRLGLSLGKKVDQRLGHHEWWLQDLADELRISESMLRRWLQRGWVHGRKTPLQRFWIAWADAAELRRLRRLRKHRQGRDQHIPHELLTPKKRKPRDHDQDARK
jgi:DNA invertase Pin-like site-specific DNA recombinase